MEADEEMGGEMEMEGEEGGQQLMWWQLHHPKWRDGGAAAAPAGQNSVSDVKGRQPGANAGEWCSQSI